MTSNRRPHPPRIPEVRRLDSTSIFRRARAGALRLITGEDLARRATVEALFRDPAPRVFLLTLGRRRRVLGIPVWASTIRVALTRERRDEISDAWIRSAKLPKEVVS